MDLIYALSSTVGTTHTTLTYVTDQITTVVSQFIAVMEALVVNPFFAFLFACGFVRIMMSLIKKAKKTSR